MTMTPVSILAQAAAEYGAITARRASDTPVHSFQEVIDGVRGYVSDHTLAVILGAVVVFALLRIVFAAPRVR